MTRLWLPVVLLLLAGAGPANTWYPTTAPIPPQMHVEWGVEAVPDERSATEGAVSFRTVISFAGKALIDHRLTGLGCVGGPFTAPDVSIRTDTNNVFSFDATSAERGSAIWRGTLKGGVISGEILISLPPDPRAEEIRRKPIDRETIRRTRAIRNPQGEIVNEDELRFIESDAPFQRNIAIAHGRTLRFTFTTLATRIVPIGDWPASAPATRPSR